MVPQDGPAASQLETYLPMGTDWHQGLFSPLEGEEVRLRGEGVVL